MQKTREQIITYLRENGTATVEELSAELGNLTPVTVRHHLDVLRSQGLVDPPEAEHRDSPGRPRYVYRLSDKAEALFPQNLNVLTSALLSELKETLPAGQVNVIFEGVADRMASAMPAGAENEPLEDRLNRVVAHLTERGYEANWETSNEGYLLHTSNCPYSGIIGDHNDLCEIDMVYISKLLGRVPRKTGSILENDSHQCSYAIPIG